MRNLSIHRILLLASALLCVLHLSAQRHEVLSPSIASLQVVAEANWLSIPVAQLDKGARLTVSFDDLTHEYHRYTYRLEHMEADWTPSEGLFENDYLQGFAADNTIENIAESEGTNQLYTHYEIQLPNDRCRITMSGNYRLTVVDDDRDQEPVLTACFMVCEDEATVGLSMTTNTDIDINRAHQQISATVGYGSLRVTDPDRQLRLVVLQNGRWDNSVVAPRPQYVMASGLRWDHCRELIFPAGNVYRKMEMLDVTHPTMGIEQMGWDGERYHAWIWTDEPRPSYLHDESAQGAFYLRNSDNIANDTQSDYLMAHFRLRSPRLSSPVYLNAAWTLDRFEPQYEMTWNEAEQLYEAALWLKQGYYSYQYLTLTADGTYRPVPSEGSFYQTDNRYDALLYFRGTTDRTDRLVGHGAIGKK